MRSPSSVGPGPGPASYAAQAGHAGQWDAGESSRAGAAAPAPSSLVRCDLSQQWEREVVVPSQQPAALDEAEGVPGHGQATEGVPGHGQATAGGFD